MPSRVVVVGAGWLGLAAAQALSNAGHAVRSTARSPEGLARIREAGLDAVRLDLDVPVPPGALSAEAVVVVIPPPRGVEDPEARYAAQIQRAREAAERDGAERLVMTGSTSVYADVPRTVREPDAGPHLGPLKRNGPAVWAAERTLLQGPSPLKHRVVLRLGGLYGPDRHPGRWLAGKTGVERPRAPVNLVHRDGAVAAIRAVVAASGSLKSAYNVVAAEHPARADFYPAAARALGLEPPRFDETDGRGGKLVSGQRLQERFGLVLPVLDAEGEAR